MPQRVGRCKNRRIRESDIGSVARAQLGYPSAKLRCALSNGGPMGESENRVSL